ncbi:MAG: hypothetical protein HOP31_00705 [Ignavibacteria bacterium]|nr:hypothetical protein [Ignavibacteria bacterium]
MSAQIEILEIVLLFTAIVLFSFGIVGSRLNLAEKHFFKFTFAAVLVLSFISLQTAIIIYVIKFDIYFGWNAALLIWVLTAIVSSPFILRIINSARLFNFGKLPPRKLIQPSEVKKDEKPKLAEVKKQTAARTFVEEPKIKEEPTHIKSAEIVQPVEVTPEPVKPAEDIASEVIPEEKSTKETASKKTPVKKRTPVKKAQLKKPASKTKPRGKK